VKEQRWQGSFELKLLQRQYPYYDEGVLGAIVADSSPVRQLITELVILANQVIAALPARYSGNLPGTTAREAEDVQEMIRLVSNLGSNCG